MAAFSLAPLALLAACGGSSRSSVAAAVASPRPLATSAVRVVAVSSVDSGLRIRVLYGPTCPVQRAGQSCVRPYEASIRILREPHNRLVTIARSAANGLVRVHLTPARYLLVPQSGRPFPRGSPQTAVVYHHRFTSVTVYYDSGIR